MKNFRKTIVLGALLSCGAATAVIAATTGTSNSASGLTASRSMHAPGGPGNGMHGARGGTPFFEAIHRLNLTTEQQSTVRGFVETAKQQRRSSAGPQANVNALSNPGDPNYVSAVATAKNAAALRIQQQSDLQVQIYGLLTPEQQAKLPQVLSEMKVQHEQRRADWQQNRRQHAEPASATP